MPSPEETSIPVEYLTTARLGEKGQITLPKAYRDTVALEVGAPVTMLQLGSGLLLIPEDTRPPASATAVSEAGPLRLFLDSNVLTGGIVAP